MVDSHVCKTNDEINSHRGELDSGVGVDDFPEEVRKKRIGSSSKKNLSSDNKLHNDNLDKAIKKVFNPKNKDDPFRSENWTF